MPCSIKLFTPGSATPEDYNGPRSAKALADAAVGAFAQGIDCKESFGMRSSAMQSAALLVRWFLAAWCEAAADASLHAQAC